MAIQCLYEDAQKIRTAVQDLRALRAAFRVAEEMGARLGQRQVLFGTVPPCYWAGERQGRAGRGLTIVAQGLDLPAGNGVVSAGDPDAGFRLRR
jgi:sirohydrochlorin ferrochelatase